MGDQVYGPGAGGPGQENLELFGQHDQVLGRSVLVPEGFDRDNANHNPSRRPCNLRMRPGWLAIQFPLPPLLEEARAGIVLPGRKVRDPGKTRAGFVDADHPPNCARVFAAGENCVASPGEYVFFHMRVEDGREAHWVKPQPLIPGWDPTDRRPSLWALKDEHVIASLPHAGDAALVEVEGNVEVLSLSGRWITVGGVDLTLGERFRSYDRLGNVAGVYLALGSAIEAGEHGVSLLAAPYDGPEAK